MTDAAQKVVTMCLGGVLRDEPWQDFGFAKRPRYGTFFQRFRPTWKVDLENRIMLEMLATFTAAHAIAERITPEDIPSVIGAYTANASLVAAFGFSSREEGEQHFAYLITQYIKTPVEKWHVLLLRQIAATSIPDKELLGRLLVGGIQFAQNVGNMILVLKGEPQHDGV